MNAKEQLLLKETIGSQTVRKELRTRTCIDVGLWWRKKPLWLVVTNEMVVLLAISRRKHVEQVSLSSCREVYYSPSGGELVISSEPALRFPRLKMPASQALEVIDLIESRTLASTSDAAPEL